MHKVVLSRTAAKAYQSQDLNMKKRLNAAVERLALDPHSAPHTRRLVGSLGGLWRCWVGEWRIIYEIDDPEQVVRIAAIVPRSKAY